MAQIVCYPAEFGLAPDSSCPNDLSVGGTSISEYFRAASQTADGSSAIALSVDWSRQNALAASGQMMLLDDDALQGGLGQLLQGVPRGQPSIGLIFGNLYSKWPDAYGFMFDLDQNNSAYGPRQGCAVFLGKVHAASSSAAGFNDLAVYTAIHEIGHAFNLWHVAASSFMLSSPQPDISGSLGFTPEESGYLACAGNPQYSGYVIPGGSDFNDRGPIPGVPSNDGSTYLAPAQAGLKLKIGLSRQELWYFEPFELDVELSVTGSSARSAEVPQIVDPGHSQFSIFITRPDGEIFKYRSSRHFCRSDAKLTVPRDKPYRRDISLFRMRGGCTLNMPGVYGLQVAMEIAPGKSIRSNIAKLSVASEGAGTPRFRVLEALLHRPDMIAMLRYKSRPPSRATYQALRDAMQDHAGLPGMPFLHYALSRSFASAAAREAGAASAAHLRELSRRHGDQAVGRGELGAHREARLAESCEKD